MSFFIRNGKKQPDPLMRKRVDDGVASGYFLRSRLSHIYMLKDGPSYCSLNVDRLVPAYYFDDMVLYFDDDSVKHICFGVKI